MINAETSTSELTARDVDEDYASMSDWYFQVVFVGTAVVIVSSTLAERIKVWPFLIFTVGFDRYHLSHPGHVLGWRLVIADRVFRFRRVQPLSIP